MQGGSGNGNEQGDAGREKERQGEQGEARRVRERSRERQPCSSHHTGATHTHWRSCHADGSYVQAARVHTGRARPGQLPGLGHSSRDAKGRPT
ncbi:hypothetical protein Pmani_013646 [Petrolisthes manimaculis]|uniref:Uncharacterized protein n=1 Tax=Petrolisthes manimaculis TaxID=1843537 RepID=A0AAE1PUR0_9EUCA|nr:hypothetical protein Pmani_013646 [Petrolisthes manimaculis]